MLPSSNEADGEKAERQRRRETEEFLLAGVGNVAAGQRTGGGGKGEASTSASDDRREGRSGRTGKGKQKVCGDIWGAGS